MIKQLDESNAQWDKLKRFIQTDVVIVEETEAKLVLFHKTLSDTIFLSSELAEDSDIYSKLSQKRGGNPYRVWQATDKFWNNPRRPKATWGKYFSSSFLKILRSPAQAEDKSRVAGS